MVNYFNVEAIENAKPVLLMIVVQSIYAATGIMLKMVAADGGLGVLIAYRFVFSSLFIVPFALLYERISMRYLTWKVLFQAFLCGLFGGSLQQNLYVKSLSLVPVSYTFTILNLIPAITYIMAVSLKLEKPNLGTAGGKAKLLGTLIGISGAMILTLYEGRRLFKWSTHIDLLRHATTQLPKGAPTGSHVWGLVLAFATALTFSLWFITQSWMTVKFPWHYSIAALTSVMGAIQSFVFALCTERDWSKWKLDWNLRLLTAAFAGILASGVCFTLLAWCVNLKGPLFVSAFNPLMLVLVAFAGVFVLNEYVTIGSLTGATLVVCGLYMLLWGKGKEAARLESNSDFENSPVQCDSINIANSPLVSNQKERDKNIPASVAPDTSLLTVNNNTSAEVQQLNT